MPRRRSSLAATLALVLTACAPDPADTAAPVHRPAAPPTAPPVKFGVTPAFGQASSAPRFAWGSGAPLTSRPGATVEAQAMDAVRTIAPTYGLSPASLAHAQVSAVRAQANGATVVEVAQRVDGVDVVGAKLKLLFDRDGRFVAAGGRLAPDTRTPRALPGGSFDAAAAIRIALHDLGAPPVPASAITSAGKRRGLYDDYVAPGLASPARARAVLVESTHGLARAFEVEVFARVAGAEKGARYVVSASTGGILASSNLVRHAPFRYRVWADPSGDRRPASGPHDDYSPHPTGLPDQSTPPFVPPSLVEIDGFNVHHDPWLPAGALASTGNNVDAYTDDGNPDGFSGAPDLRATPNAGSFDFTYDVALDPLANDTQRMASVTAAFYTLNWLHDDWYDAGFDEKAGNAQASNLGRGGVEGDVLLVEVQDRAPSQLDNANAFTPSDGASPRIQLFLWSATSSSSVSLGAQSFATGIANFGPGNFGFTSEIARADDGSGIPNDGCQAIGPSVVGKIALVDRGTCSFKQKVVNAQDAGATGVIIANVMPGGPPFMPDGPPNTPVTIPVLSVSQADGQILEQAILAGPTSVTMTGSIEPLRDGALDNLVVAHEWGHYLHLRLSTCDSHQCEAESEGWGDYVALALAVKEGDDLNGVYSDSTYAAAATSDDAPYFGTRRFPYTANMAKNPLTFQHIGAGVPLPTTAPINGDVTSPNDEVHAAGEVWASMVFEAHLALLANASKPNAPYTFAEARKRMASYVVTGLQLAPDSPTYTEQRDAILAAATANDPADALLIAQAFAKRGAGSCAVSPPDGSTDLNGVVESFVVAPSPAITSVTLADDTSSCDDDGYLDGAEAGTVRVTIENPSPAALTGATLTLVSSDGAVTFPAGPSSAVPMLAGFGATTLEIPVARSIATKAVAQIDATLDAPTACTPSATVTTAFPVSVDEAPTNTDGFETSGTTWELFGEGADASWSIQQIDPTNRAFRGVDASESSDRSLVSPPISVAAGANLVVGFSHAYSFETSNDTFWDGGVIEISKDGGPWEDVSKYANPAYVADVTNMADNPLAGRPAYVGLSSTFPVPLPETLMFGSSFGGSTVKLRFRIGTDAATGDEGWVIDEVVVAGAASPPFVGLVPDACVMGATTSAAATTASSSTGSGAGGGGGTPPADDDGCGCVVAAEPSSVRPALVLMGIALGALRFRKRGRRRSGHQQS